MKKKKERRRSISQMNKGRRLCRNSPWLSRGFSQTSSGTAWVCNKIKLYCRSTKVNYCLLSVSLKYFCTFSASALTLSSVLFIHFFFLSFKNWNHSHSQIGVNSDANFEWFCSFQTHTTEEPLNVDSSRQWFVVFLVSVKTAVNS